MENLETTKRTATEIEEKVKEAKITEVKINEARELYRPAAARASLLYFILNDLNKISPMYQFSLKVSVVNVEGYSCTRKFISNALRIAYVTLLPVINVSVQMYGILWSSHICNLLNYCDCALDCTNHFLYL